MDLSGFPNTEAEFRARFADDNRCREYLARLKWPEGFRCAAAPAGLRTEPSGSSASP